VRLLPVACQLLGARDQGGVTLWARKHVLALSAGSGFRSKANVCSSC